MMDELSNSEANRRRLTPQEFIEIITLVNEEKYAEFYGSFNFYGRSIIIKDVILDKIVISNDLVVCLPLIIVDGIFNCFQIVGGAFQGHLRFESCTFRDEFRIEGGIFHDFFLVDESSFHDYFLIQNGIFKNYFRIKDCTFKGYFNIRGGTFQSSFWIENVIFKDSLTIENGTFQRIFKIVDATFHKIFTILGGDFQGQFSSFDNTFHEKCWIYGPNTFQDEFLIEGGNFKNALAFESGQINRLTINKITSKIELEVFEKFIINSFKICAIIQKDSLIILASTLYLLEFNTFQNFGTIVLNNISSKNDPSKFNINLPYNPQGDFSAPPQLHIENSDLGKMMLINSNLSGFNLVFRSSKITDLFVTGTLMPSYVSTTNENGQPDFRQHQLGYSQIKKIYEARGDRVEANRYYAREMEAYQQTLSWGKFGDIGEKLNLTASKYSTDYGQSWVLGLLSTLLVSSFFYFLYCLALGYRPSLIVPEKDLFSKLASYFLEFLNPIHKADYVAEQLFDKKADIPGTARTIEGLSRIFIAYFVYQLIQAFRKHGKATG